MIPLVHDFSDERVLVFGGGNVGARKARRFDHEATVFVVSPSFEGADFGEGRLVRAHPTPDTVGDWIDWVDPVLVVIATDDSSLNDAIDSAARDRSILRNRADRAGSRGFGNVIVPATVRDGPVLTAVSTEGTSPVVSRHVREQLEATIEGAGKMAILTGELREELSGAEREGALRSVVESEEVWKALDSEGAKSRQVAKDVIDDVTGEMP